MGGTSVTVTGSAFTYATGVTFDGVAATDFVVVGDTTITCTAPAHAAGAVDVMVQSPYGNGTLVEAFMYETIPVLTGLTPEDGPDIGGTPVVLAGTDLDLLTDLSLGGDPIPFVIDSPTSVRFTTPSHAMGVADLIAVYQTPPEAPDLLISITSDTVLHLSWTEASPVTGYELERSADGVTGWSQIATPASGDMSYDDTGRTGSTSYYYRLRAINIAGNSAYSDVVQAKTLPAAPVLSASVTSDTAIHLSWTEASAVTGYKLERSPNGSTGWSQIATPASGDTTYDNTGLTGNTPYYYRLCASNSSGDSSYSNTATATTNSSLTLQVKTGYFSVPNSNNVAYDITWATGGNWPASMAPSLVLFFTCMDCTADDNGPGLGEAEINFAAFDGSTAKLIVAGQKGYNWGSWGSLYNSWIACSLGNGVQPVGPVSMLTNGFQLKNNPGAGNFQPTATQRIGYIAFGGTAAAGAKVGKITGRTTTGTVSVTGLAFQPKGVFIFGNGNTEANGLSNTEPVISFGAAHGTLAAQQLVASSLESKTVGSTTRRVTSTGAIFKSYDKNTLAVDNVAALSAINADGFTLNYTGVSGAAHDLYYVAFPNINMKVGTLTPNAALNGTADFDAGFAPKGVFAFSNFATVDAAAAVGGDFGLGATDGTAQRSTNVHYCGANLYTYDHRQTSAYIVGTGDAVEKYAFDSFQGNSVRIKSLTATSHPIGLIAFGL